MTQIEYTIEHLEQIIQSIQPYSKWWRWGYIKSLRLAIKMLKEKEVKDGTERI